MVGRLEDMTAGSVWTVAGASTPEDALSLTRRQPRPGDEYEVTPPTGRQAFIRWTEDGPVLGHRDGGGLIVYGDPA